MTFTGRGTGLNYINNAGEDRYDQKSIRMLQVIPNPIFPVYFGFIKISKIKLNISSNSLPHFAGWNF